MIIRSRTFRDWFQANLSDSSRDIASHGADCGWHGLTYTKDLVKLFDRFGPDLWDELSDDAKEYGCKSVAEFIASLNSNYADTLEGFKSLVIWYFAEKVARELHPDL